MHNAPIIRGDLRMDVRGPSNKQSVVCTIPRNLHHLPQHQHQHPRPHPLRPQLPVVSPQKATVELNQPLVIDSHRAHLPCLSRKRRAQ